MAAESGWIDSHCHLDLFQERAEEVARRAIDGGLSSMVTVGTDLSSSRRAIKLASHLDGVWAAVGIHPHDAQQFDSSSFDILRSMADAEEVVAIGETGLDFYRDLCPRDVQREAFAAQVRLAKELGIALIVHMRESQQEVFDLLDREGPPEHLVFHCFSGSVTEVATALEFGGHISFAGNISFKNAESLREAARACPINRVLVETDSPFLTPVPHRGKENEPNFLPLVGEALADAMGRPVDEVCEATSQNTERVFQLRRLN